MKDLLLDSRYCNFQQIMVNFCIINPRSPARLCSRGLKCRESQQEQTQTLVNIFQVLELRKTLLIRRP